MNKPIRICIFNGVRTDNGNYHYRGFEPWQILAKKDSRYAVTHINTIVPEALDQADVIFFQRLMGANVLEVAAYYRFKGKKIIYETDDHLQQVPDWNYWSGQYDEYTVQLYEAMLEVANVITTSTSRMVDLCKKYNDQVVLCPNSVNIMNFSPRANNNIKPVIGSSVSYTARSGDYRRSEVLDVLHKFKDKAIVKILGGLAPQRVPQPHDTFEPYRSVYPINIQTAPEMVPDTKHLNGIQVLPVHPFQFHYHILSEADLDIGIACQANHHFNKFKSNLKWLEYSALGTVTVASDMPSYEMINHGVDGYLCATPKEWEETLEMLLEDSGLRDKIAKNAKERVLADFNIAKNWVNWKKAVDTAMEVE